MVPERDDVPAVGRLAGQHRNALRCNRGCGRGKFATAIRAVDGFEIRNDTVFEGQAALGAGLRNPVPTKEWSH